jgi:dienelactone hydrolase
VIAPSPEQQAREAVTCGAIAAAAAAVAVFVLPRGGDLPAHLYRTGLVSHGVLIWDNLWFAGQYPLASYSLLYYPLAWVVGNGALGVAGVVIAAVVFALIASREWRSVGPWPARAFALLLAGQAFTAAYPYDLGLATLLVTLWALQRRRASIAAVCTVLTLGFSPLAFLLLALALLALLLHRRRVNRQVLAVGAAVAAAAAIQIVALVVLPSPGLVYPYGTWRLLAGIAVAALGVALALRGRGGWALATMFLVWAGASVVAYAIPSPVGHNLIRASIFVFPLMLVAAALSDFRPRWLALTATAAALAANVVPYAAMVSARSSSVDARLAYWQPVVTFLHDHSSAAFRVEVVPTANHWESFYLPTEGIALARGWYRQLDIADNAALYAPHLTPAAYGDWLRLRAVRYVVLPHLSLEAIDAQREAAMLRSGHAGLPTVWKSRQATIYELPHPTPLLTGLHSAEVTLLDSTEIRGWIARPGTYLLRVRYTPYWSVQRGSLCLTRGPDASTRMVARSAGRFSIKAIEAPLGVVAAFLDTDRNGCRAPPRAAPVIAQPPVGLRTFRFVDRTRVARYQNGATRPRTLVTYVRYPRTGAPPYPLVVFAHGFALTTGIYARLLDALTRAGYVVAAPAFPVESPTASGGPDRSDLSNEPGDIRFVLTKLLSSPLRGLIDPTRIAVAGHSDGAAAALLAAYGDRSRDRRLDAAVILSGSELPGEGYAFAGGRPPLLAVQGTADTINSPGYTRQFFQLARRPKFLLWLIGAGHLPPYTTDTSHLAVVERATIAFLDHYLRGDPLRPLLGVTEPGVARLSADP